MEFANICRLCCTEKLGMRSILGEEETLPMRDIFSSILQIEIYPDDQLPQQICEQCTVTLLELNQTIEVFRENDLRLRQQLYGEAKGNLQTMKIEMLLEPEMEEERLDPELESTHEADTKELLVHQYIEEKQEDLIEEEPFSGDDYLPSSTEYQESIPDDEEEFVPSKRKRIPTEKAKSAQNRAKRSKATKQKRKPKAPKQPDPPKEPRRRGRKPKTKPVTECPRKNDLICYICKSEPHESQEALFNHLHTAHDGDLPYTCAVCEQETVVIQHVTTLNAHKRMHEKPFKCPHCDIRFVLPYNVDEHVKRVHSESSGRFECPHCGKVVRSAAILDLHIRRHFTRITCDICGKTYSSRTKLRTHIERKHTEDAKAVECPLCQKKLQTLDSLQNHIKVMHSNSEPLQCPHCPKSYVSKYSYQHHVKKHETNPFHRTSKDWKQYYTFIEEEGVDKKDQKKKCNLCGAVVRQISIHLIKIHFPEEFPCEVCGEVFKDRKPLEVHMYEHTHGKFLKCPICEREFKDRKYLLIHMRTKKHRDHPLAQSLDWLDALYPVTMPMRLAPNHVQLEVNSNVTEHIQI